MGRYLNALKKSGNGGGPTLQNLQNPPRDFYKLPDDYPTKPTKPEKGGFVGFVGTPPPPFEINHYQEATNSGLKLKPFGTPSAPLTASEETAIRAWLALIEETDPVTIAEVIGQCQRDAEAMDYFTGRAASELPKPDPLPDDRRTCDQCANYRYSGVCSIARPGGTVSSYVGYRPAGAAMLQRCTGYAGRESINGR